MIPISDEPNPAEIPIATTLLATINIAAFLVITLPLRYTTPEATDPSFLDYIKQISEYLKISQKELALGSSAYDIFVFKYGFRPNEPTALSLFTSMFLHGGWIHIAGNMLFLWVFGNNVEYRLGQIRYMLVYLLCGVLATLSFAFVSYDSPLPMIGASGAISGVLGCYFRWFPNNKVRMWMFLFYTTRTFFVPARFVLGTYLIVENVLPFFFSSGTSGIAYGAHIGGFAAGYIMAVAMERFLPPIGADGRVDKLAALGNRSIAQEIMMGQPFMALQKYNVMTEAQKSALDATDVFMLSDFMVSDGRHLEAIGMLDFFVKHRPDDPQVPAAHLRMGLIYAKGRGDRSKASFQFNLALRKGATGEVEAGVRKAMRELGIG